MSTQLFRLRLKAWGDAATGQLQALARQTCQEMAEQVHEATPLDIGFLRGSWQPSIKNKFEAAAATDNPSVAIAAALEIAGQVVPGDTFVMTNNAAYAKRLEFGFVGEDRLGRTYDQAGRFYVTATVKRWREIVRAVAASLGMAR